MRVRAVLTAACIAVSLLATTVPAQAATDDVAQVAVTKAKALAKAGVLTQADLPKYDVDRSTRDASDDEFDAALYGCLGIKVPKYAVRNAGRSFSRGDLIIDSSADVLSSIKAAKDDF